jgi:hypothetical protein
MDISWDTVFVMSVSGVAGTCKGRDGPQSVESCRLLTTKRTTPYGAELPMRLQASCGGSCP